MRGLPGPARRCLLALAVAGGGVAAAGCAGGTGTAGTAGGTGTTVPTSTTVLVALPLRVDAKGLLAAATQTAEPTSPRFRRFETASDIGRAYGASPSVVAQDQRVLEADGLPLAVDPTHAAFWGPVTASQVRRYFSTDLVQRDGVIVAGSAPAPPPGLVGVTGVVGLVRSATHPSQDVQGSASPPCPATLPNRTSVARLFGFEHTLAEGATGAGTRIDILATHTFQPSVFDNFDRCSGERLSTANISQAVVPTTPSWPGGPEVALDTLVMTLLAPSTKIHVVRFDPVMPIALPLLHIVADRDPPDVLDITFTYCESAIGSVDRSLSEWLLATLADEGVTSAAASGDTGSSGCRPESAPAVTYPASSAYVTAIGGAVYGGSATSPSDLRVWNVPGSAGGGGGTSSVIPAPPWQPGKKRQVPDVSAYATGSGVGDVPVCSSATNCAWESVGGTSLSATVLGAAGVLDAQLAQRAGAAARWGNLAGVLWQRGSTGGSITDVVAGGNSTYTTACCTAGPGYDRASGWGLFVADNATGDFSQP